MLRTYVTKDVFLAFVAAHPELEREDFHDPDRPRTIYRNAAGEQVARVTRYGEADALNASPGAACRPDHYSIPATEEA